MSLKYKRQKVEVWDIDKDNLDYCYKESDVKDAVREFKLYLNSSRWINLQNINEMEDKFKEIFGDFEK